MKRILGFAMAAALVVGASEAEAQDRVSSRFDLGAYGGYSGTSHWFAYDDVDFGIGGNPMFGATGTYWISETFGVRSHAGYMPARAPRGDGQPASVIINTDYPVNNWFADLGVSFRPMWGNSTNLLSSMYFWLGGGMLRSNFAGNPTPAAGQDVVCVPDYSPYATCYSFQGDFATVGQGTLGLGFDLVSLTDRLSLFGELGGHMYSSPTHSADIPQTSDKFAVTGRAVAGLKLGIGSIPLPVVPIPPPPPPPPPAPPAERQIQVCVIQNNALQNITATFLPATNDTMVNNIPFAQAHPATAPAYAAGANWFIQSNEVSFGDREWVKYGVTRVLTPTQLQRVGDYQGTSVFAEAGSTAPYEVLYIPVRPGCEFQPFTPREIIRPRG